MPFAKLNEEGRMVMWSHERLDGLDVEFSNGEFIEENCTNGLEDFVIEDGEAIFSPRPESEAKRLEAELAKTKAVIDGIVEDLISCDSLQGLLTVLAKARAEHGAIIAERREMRGRIKKLERQEVSDA